jgi:cytochrome P450
LIEPVVRSHLLDMSLPLDNQASPAAGAGSPPVRRGLPLLGLLPQMRRDILSVLRAAQREQGDVVRLAMPGRQSVFLVSHPELIRSVLQDNPAHYPRSRLYDKLKPVLGNGLVTSEGELWRRHRRLIQPSFRAQRIRQFVATMGAATAELAGRWERAAGSIGSLDVAREMSSLALTILVRSMFSQSGRYDDIRPAVHQIQELLAARFWSLSSLFDYLPSPANRRFRHALRTLDAAVDAIIAARQTSDRLGDDLLGQLLGARDPDTGEALDRTALRDEVMTMFLAGHETSANGLTWTWYLLARHPDWAERVQAEAQAVLARRVPEPADLDGLSVTRRVIQEALRLYPPVPWLSREAVGPAQLGGYNMPAGSILLVSPFVMHRDPRWWPEPDRFDPERFAPSSPDRRLPYSYFPFGGGPHTCIGHHFALTEMVVVLAMLSARFHLRLMASAPVAMQADVTLRPAGGMPMSIDLRS